MKDIIAQYVLEEQLRSRTMSAGNPSAELGAFEPNISETTALWILNGGGTYTLSPYTFHPTRIDFHKTPLLVANFAKKILLVNLILPYQHKDVHFQKTLLDMTTFTQPPREKYYFTRSLYYFLENQELQKHWFFVPVISFPHHQMNVDYLNNSIDVCFRSLVRKQGNFSEHGTTYRKLEAAYRAYHDFHGLDHNMETLAERSARLGLQKAFAGFTARQLKNRSTT